MNIVVKSTLPRSASSADKLNEIISQLKQKYQGRTIYTLAEIKKENKEVNFDTVSKWSKEVNGVPLGDYLLSIGILTPIQYFDIVEQDILVEDIKGKRCCAFQGNGTINTFLQDDMVKCGAIIVPPNSNEIDYVCGAGLRIVSKIPQDNRDDVYSLFDRRDKGKLNFEVVAYGFQYKVEAYIKSLMLTQEERTALGISTYNQPQEIICDYGYTIINNIKLEDIPQYDTTKHYWSLNYFYGWYEASGGKIKSTLDHYSVRECEDPENIIKKNFDVFSDLCNRMEDKQIQSYIKRKAHMLRSESKKSMILASLGYISDFDGCWCVVLKAGRGDVFTVRLQKVKMLSLWDGCDYDLERLEENDIPATLRAMIEDDIRDYAFRNTPGYIWIDNPSGEISKGAFANDPNIKYVEMSDNINKIDFNAFANCANLESVKIGRAVETINAGAFSNCCNLKNVAIPASVKIIDPRCFKDCSNLSEVIFEGESRCEKICMDAFADSPNVVIVNGGYPEKFAKKNNIAYKNNGEVEPPSKQTISREVGSCIDNEIMLKSKETYQKQIDEAERKAREEAERKEREEEALRKAKEVASGNSIDEAYRKAQEDAERRKREVAEREAKEAARKAEEEAKRIAEEAENSRRQEQEAKERLEVAYRKAQEDAERRKRDLELRQAREEAERKKREEIERKCREAEERRIRAEEERKAKEEAKRKAREEERRAREEAQRQAEEEAKRKLEQEKENAIKGRAEFTAAEKEKIDQAYEKMVSELTAAFEAKRSELQNQIEINKKLCATKEQELAQASFFAFIRKKNLKRDIELNRYQMKKTEDEMSALLKDHTEKLHDEEIKHKNKINALPMRAAKKFPMPK